MSKIENETRLLKSGYNKFQIFGGSRIRETFLLLSAVERLKIGSRIEIGSRNEIGSRKIIDAIQAWLKVNDFLSFTDGFSGP